MFVHLKMHLFIFPKLNNTELGSKLAENLMTSPIKI